MNIRSLRFRLVTWYTVWLGSVFIAAGMLLYFGLHHYLEHNLAVWQTQRAQRIANLVSRIDVASGGNLAAHITADFAPEASGRYVRVTDLDGLIFYQSGSPHDQSFDPAQISRPPHPAGIRKEQLSDGRELIIATAAVGKPGVPRYFVETGESLTPAFTELRRLLVSLVLVFTVVAGVVLGGSYFLVQRALRPIEKITRSAEGITSRNLSERLPVLPTGDEIEHLSQALNRMITRLDEAFQHNRRFLADASHELRTPLTILRSEMEAMVRREQLDASLREDVGSFLEEVERLAHIVENLFALSRLDAGMAQKERTRFDLAKLATTTAEQMCLLAEDKGLSINCDTPAPVFVDGARARLKQVVVNLLDNAIKYSTSGGTVKLAVTALGEEAVFEVSDNGIGIPPDALPHVFDRFFRVDEARNRELGGAGIGLSIVKAICAAHDGRAEVESTKGRGSLFRIHLPLAKANISQ